MLTKIWDYRNLISTGVWIGFAIADAFIGNTVTAFAEVVVSALFFYMFQLNREEWKNNGY